MVIVVFYKTRLELFRCKASNNVGIISYTDAVSQLPRSSRALEIDFGLAVGILVSSNYQSLSECTKKSTKNDPRSTFVGVFYVTEKLTTPSNKNFTK